MSFIDIDLGEEHAAVKYGLRCIIRSVMREQLAQLIRADQLLSGFGGDGGWELNRRTANDDINWPQNTDFRAYVIPDDLILATPEKFYTRKDFFHFVRSEIDAYLRDRPERVKEMAPILEALEAQGNS